MTQMRVLEKANEKRYTLGVVYEPDVTDTQGEFAKAADIEVAAWDFMDRLQSMAKSGTTILAAALRSGTDGVKVDITEMADVLEKGAGLDDEHLQVGDDEHLGSIVESYIAPCDFSIGAQTIKKGSWLLGVRWSPEMFGRIKKGERTGLSMYGRTGRVRET